MKGLKVKEVRLSFTFNKDVTVKKTVEIFVNDVRDAIKMIPSNETELLEDAKRDVLELLAIILNKQSVAHGRVLLKSKDLL